MYNTFGDVFVNPIAGLIVASVWGTVLTLPFDNIRTRLMNQFPDKNLNRINYTGVLSVIQNSIKYEGTNALFVGMIPHYAHILVYSALVRIIFLKIIY
jgi:Mitochondrial carrier protein